MLYLGTQHISQTQYYSWCSIPDLRVYTLVSWEIFNHNLCHKYISQFILRPINLFMTFLRPHVPCEGFRICLLSNVIIYTPRQETLERFMMMTDASCRCWADFYFTDFTEHNIRRWYYHDNIFFLNHKIIITIQEICATWSNRNPIWWFFLLKFQTIQPSIADDGLLFFEILVVLLCRNQVQFELPIFEINNWVKLVCIARFEIKSYVGL